MMGYLAQPELGLEHVSEIEKKTAGTIDKDGWLHSGDKGIVCESGMVKVTGRYKEIIIGAGGENIAPVPIEDHIKASCDGINEVIMIGDKQKYNVALVTLKVCCVIAAVSFFRVQFWFTLSNSLRGMTPDDW